MAALLLQRMPPPCSKNRRVSVFVGRQPFDLFSSAGAVTGNVAAGVAVRVMQTSPRSGGPILEDELYLRFTRDGQNNGDSCEIYTFLY